ANASVAPSARARAYVRHAPANSASGHTRVTRPIRSASSALTGSPVRIMSVALPNPTMRGRKYADPASGTRPTRVHAARNDADDDATRTSHATAIPRPAPATTPFTAATTGLRILRSDAMSG